jgi:LAO/AO transport system kinase
VDHQLQARELLNQLMPKTGKSVRVGITGVPGVGKSTFVETLGCQLVDAGHRVAVLAVDPTSVRSGGSILGDKTRMERLSKLEGAFIRPSPTAGSLGGVASKTRETMLLCEAAGYDVVLVETVGVGQSEVTVAGMTDFFLVLMLAGAGDELQGIKRGLMEVADALVVNKADGDNALPARRAAATYRSALHLLHPPDKGWSPPVMTCSGLTGEGVAEVWATVETYRQHQGEGWATRRREQLTDWMWSLVDDELRRRARASGADLEARVTAGEIGPTWAADALLDRLDS